MKRPAKSALNRLWAHTCVALAVASASCGGSDAPSEVESTQPDSGETSAEGGDAAADDKASADGGDSATASPRGASARPNVLFLLADDLGYGDLRGNKHPYAKTPNLDKLARQGTKYDRFYSTGTVCNPSRTGWMTSVHPWKFAQNTADYGFRGQPTVTSLLRKAGYKTGHCGKWHIGPDEKNGTYGIDYINTSPPRSTTNKARDAYIYECAMDFLAKHNRTNPGQPFYLNVWGYSTHAPVNPHPSLVEPFADLEIDESKFGPWMKEKFADARELGVDPNVGMRNYLADVRGLDQNVGRLLAKLDALGLSENTIVVFSSDNGPAPVNPLDLTDPAKRAIEGNMLGWAGGLRGGKHNFYEGGVRVPFIVRWPGRVPEGRVDTTSIVSALDFLPTLASIVGIPAPRNVEGYDLSKAWQGKSFNRPKPLFWKWGSPVMVYQNWKYFVSRDGSPELYDLRNDPAERRNLAGTKPALERELRAMGTEWLASLPRPVSANRN